MRDFSEISARFQRDTPGARSHNAIRTTAPNKTDPADTGVNVRRAHAVPRLHTAYSARARPSTVLVGTRAVVTASLGRAGMAMGPCRGSAGSQANAQHAIALNHASARRSRRYSAAGVRCETPPCQAGLGPILLRALAHATSRSQSCSAHTCVMLRTTHARHWRTLQQPTRNCSA